MSSADITDATPKDLLSHLWIRTATLCHQLANTLANKELKITPLIAATRQQLEAYLQEHSSHKEARNG